jgi:cyclopropane fatty-acyl-phospholipid synthase-like methyltransferase
MSCNNEPPPTPASATTTSAASNPEDDIKTMELYNDIARIENELRWRGIGDDAALNPQELSSIDSMHYEGDDAIRAAIKALNLSSASHVLDIGSGFGGPARLLAAEAKSSVVAMELQLDIHEMATSLTKRCHLDDLVSHFHGDILHCDLSSIGAGPGSFDAVVSWLVFLHISDKHALFSKCNEMLKAEGGKLFCDDFFMLKSFTSEQDRSLKNDVYCADLPSKVEYIQELECCGFHNITFEDRTGPWTVYVNERLKEFVANRERFESIHGEPPYKHLLHFYTAIVNLFNSGSLGGVRITAEKKNA